MAGVLLGHVVDDTEAAELQINKIGSDGSTEVDIGRRLLKLYTAGLYLKEKSRSANSIIMTNEAMSIRIKVTSNSSVRQPDFCSERRVSKRPTDASIDTRRHSDLIIPFGEIKMERRLLIFST